LISLLP
jgi:hypothetical protein